MGLGGTTTFSVAPRCNLIKETSKLKSTTLENMLNQYQFFCKAVKELNSSADICRLYTPDASKEANGSHFTCHHDVVILLSSVCHVTCHVFQCAGPPPASVTTFCLVSTERVCPWGRWGRRQCSTATHVVSVTSPSLRRGARYNHHTFQLSIRCCFYLCAAFQLSHKRHEFVLFCFQSQRKIIKYFFSTTQN